jgi:uncharacterized surface protein with fasciclin (FAS1) repeats
MKVRIALVTLLLVLVPFGLAMAQPTNLYDTLAAAGNYKTFLSLVDKANVKELKSMQGPFTVFAPNDAAFAAVPQATMDKIMGDPAIVRDVVYFHITPGKYLQGSAGTERMQDPVPHRQRRDHEIHQDGRQIYGE